jgi:GDPmannose 4,6-dehydratase
LEQLGYCVVGIGRDSFDITRADAVDDFVRRTVPDEIYFLAAHHHSAQGVPDDEGALFRQSNAVHFVAAVNFLDAIARVSIRTRLFFASSSLIFASASAEERQSEATVPAPEGAYAITKVAGMQACRHFRKNKNVFASCGILYNHESPLRGEQFLSRQIVRTAARIKQGHSDRLELGDLEARVDWGYAPDYVDAMHRILQLDEPQDFVIATGELHTVRDFVDYAFGSLGLDYRAYVTVNPAKLRRVNSARRGDSTKLRTLCEWEPSRSFKAMVEGLAQAELAALASAKQYVEQTT